MSTTTYAAVTHGSDYTFVREWPRPMYAAGAPPAVWPIAIALLPPLPGPARPRRERRATMPARTRLRFGGWELDLIERRLTAPGGGTERIPGLEFALLKTLIADARRPLSRSDLANRLTRDGDAPLSGRSVDSYVSRLRRRLGRGGSTSLISTVWAIGYRFDADVVQG